MIGLWMGLAMAGSVEGAGIELTWTVKDGLLVGTARSPGPGWVAVGFNDRPELAGSVLLMAALPSSGAQVEEHVARPPNHPRRKAGGLVNSSVVREQDTLVFHFSWKLQTGDELVAGLKSGAPVHITLAWSRDPAFDHHSAERVMVTSVL